MNNQDLIKDIIKEDTQQTKIKQKNKDKEKYVVPLVYNDTPSIEKTFNKSNRIIKGGNSIKSSKHSHNLGNYLYREMNLRMVYNKGILNDNKVSIPLMDVKKTLQIRGKDYDKIISQSLEDLKNGKIKLETYTDKKGRKFNSVSMSLISSFDREKLSNGEVVYNLKISKKMIEFLNENSSGNYTIIHNKYTAILQSVKQIKLYEFCYQYLGFNKGMIKNLTLEKLNIIFQSDYKYLSRAKEQMNKSIKDINQKTDITISFVSQENKKVLQLIVIENEKRVKDRYQVKKRKKMLQENKGQGEYKLKNTEEELSMIDKLLNT